MPAESIWLCKKDYLFLLGCFTLTGMYDIINLSLKKNFKEYI